MRRSRIDRADNRAPGKTLSSDAIGNSAPHHIPRLNAPAVPSKRLAAVEQYQKCLTDEVRLDNGI
jgi:hypothetical protein